MTSNDLKKYVFTLASNDLRGHRGQNSILKRHHVVILGIKMTSNDLKNNLFTLASIERPLRPNLTYKTPSCGHFRHQELTEKLEAMQKNVTRNSEKKKE